MLTYTERLKRLAEARRVSVPVLAKEAGLHREYARIAENHEKAAAAGKKGPYEPKDAKVRAIAERWGASFDWLKYGRGDMDDQSPISDVVSPQPPPASVTRITSDRAQALVSRCMDPSRGHTFDDGYLVVEALRLGATLDQGDDENSFVGRLLDTSVKYRGRKPPIQARDLISLTLARVVDENERLRQQMAEADQHGADWRRENHLTEGERPTHPLLLEAAEEATRPGPKGRRR